MSVLPPILLTRDKIQTLTLHVRTVKYEQEVLNVYIFLPHHQFSTHRKNISFL